MMDILLPLFVSLLIGQVVAQNHVCLKAIYSENTLLLQCKIDRMVFGVEFVSPNGSLYGSCPALVPPELTTREPKDCGNNITQYVDVNSTVLRLENPQHMLGLWTCRHGTLWSNDTVNITNSILQEETTNGYSPRNRDICVSYKITKDHFKLECKVNEYDLFLQFLHWEKSAGNCNLPAPDCSSTVTCFRNNTFDIVRNCQSKITTLSVNRSTYDVTGNWTCKLGSFSETVTVEIPDSKECSPEFGIEFGIISILLLIIIIIIVVCIVRYKASCATVQNEQQHISADAPEQIQQPLISDENGLSEVTIDQSKESCEVEALFTLKPVRPSVQVIDLPESNASGQSIIEDACDTCNSKVSCAICGDCMKVFCEICCGAHTVLYPTHSICEIEHYFKSKAIIKCKGCFKDVGNFICRQCRTIVCHGCSNYHAEHRNKMLPLNPVSTAVNKDSSSLIKKYEPSYSFRIDRGNNANNLRICGIAFLTRTQIAVVDGNNHKLLVYDNWKLLFSSEFSTEPRGITSMTDNLVAITFGYTSTVVIYKVKDNCIDKVDSVRVGDVLQEDKSNVKTFSIAYSKNNSGRGFLAVEVGEGDNGRILILTEDLTIHKLISNRDDFAYFTGNTIRLALDMTGEGNIVISVMSKKLVSCINLEGKLIWKSSVPSPRSLIVLPEQLPTKRRIILASRRCNAIFLLNENDGSYRAVSNVNSPRYMAYHHDSKLLCVHTSYANPTDPSEAINVYEYKDFVI